MNKHLYRTVFNQKTGVQIAVAETACSRGKGRSSGNAVARIAAFSTLTGLFSPQPHRLTRLVIGIAALFGGVTLADAQVVAYRNAPGNQRPTVLQTGNGVPLVNIQTPSAQGVSRNVYSQFDVDSKGVILNNARNNALTQLGGWVQGNPWLAVGTAKVIVNEVNSANPSYLRGYVEVAGDRAQVIIANPSGLYVGNAGFINASRATLTTGLPGIVGGALDAYRVTGGTVTIDGAGLDAKSTDYTDIMARAVQVNAGIWANDLKISTGVNQISADHSNVASTTGATGTAPVFAVDVARLAGMYSGKITLTGTEHGVGMNNAGTIGAGAGDVVVTVDGLLQNKGSITATQHIVAGATGLNNHGGQFQAGGSTTLDLGPGQLDNSSGLIRSNIATTLTAASINNSNTIGTDLGIQGQAVTIAATTLNNKAGAIRANTDLMMAGTGVIDNTGGSLSAGQTLNVYDTHAAGAPKTQTIVNTGGTLIAGKQLSADSAAMTGDGKALSLGDLSIKLDADFTHTGTTQADGNATIATTGELINSGKLLAGKTLAASAASIDNQAGGQLIASSMQLKAADIHTFTNRGLIDGSDTFIDSPTINNLGTGRIYGDHVALSASTLNNLPETVNGVTSAPVIAARMRMDLGVTTINNSDHALIYSAGDLVTANALDAGHQAIGMGDAINNASATIAADGNATINHKVVNNTNAHLETTVDYSTGRRIVQFRLNGATDKLDGSTVRLVNRGSGQTLSADNWQAMGDEDNFRLVLPSSTYSFERYGAALRQAAYTPGYSTGGGDYAPVVDYPEVYAYAPTDGIWQTMGVTPPVSATLIGPAPALPGRQECSGEHCYFVPATPEEYAAWQTAYAAWRPAYDRQQASYQALNNAIDAFNSNLQGRMIREWTIYDGTEQVARTRVLRSDPAMINVGGNLRFNSQAVNNANSQIIAGGDLSGDNILGTTPVNTGLAGTQVVTTTGSAAYTYIKSHGFSADDRRYDSRPYEGQSVQTSFVLDITPTNGSGARQDNALKSIPGAVPGNAAMVVRTSNPDIALPDSALYVPGNDRYLIATDPQFAGYRNWLGADFMLNQLGQNPALVQKRLGDGYYEQQLVMRQIQKAIGQRYAGNAASNEAQYQALMTAGVQMAQTFQYQLGVALTAQQMALLTADIVWLVKQSVTLADGSTQEVLVPQVYLRANRMQVTGEGTLIAGNNVNFQSAGDILNNGTIAAKNTTTLAAGNINNLGGRISGADTLLAAATDINNLGGAIDAVNSVTATAGRDINVNSTSVSTANATTTGANIDSVASITGSSLALTAGRDLTANAAVINATGNATLTASRDIKLGTVNQNFTERLQWDGDRGASPRSGAFAGPKLVDQSNRAHGGNRATLSISEDVATQINGDNITLRAGRDLSTQGAQVVAASALTAVANRDINIGTANTSASARDQHQHSSSGILSSTTTQTDDASSYSRQSGSTFSGNTTVIAAGNNANITGSDVVSTQGTQVTAVKDINITAATDSSSESHYKKETTSGIFSGGGLGVTVGSRMQSTDQTHATTTAAGSTVGATNGNVSLAAGQHYTQIASTVIAPQGNVGITGQQVDILAGVNTEQNTQETQFRQQGLTVQISNPVVSAVQTAQSLNQAREKAKDGRMTALALAATALVVSDAASQVSAAPKQAGGVNMAISLGASKNESRTVQNNTTAEKSIVVAGGNISIAATGGGQTSDLTIAGSQITSGNDIQLKAEHNINIVSTQNTAEQHSKNSSSSASAGIGIGPNGFTINANLSKGRGHADGNDVTQANSHVDAANQLSIESGVDSNIRGGVVSGKQVIAKVGTSGQGNLNIESRQDTSVYASKQESMSMGISVPTGAGTGSANFSQNKSVSNSNYANVDEQSGIQSGDGGFQLTVNENTNLQGGKIASNDKAVTAGVNTLITQTLTISDIENKSTASASNTGISLSSDMATQGKYGVAKAIVGNALNRGKESASAVGETQSAISTGQIIITDDARQKALTGQDGVQVIAGLNRDTANANKTVQRQDIKAMEQSAQAKQEIKQAIYQQAAKLTDESYRTLFIKKALMYEVSLNENGEVTRRLLSPEEKNNLKRGDDGKVHIANNGIFNDEVASAKYAYQHSTSNGPQYMIYFPEANSMISELLIAGYQKYLENDTMGLANATQETKNMMNKYGQDGLLMDGHSRGSMTIGNAMESIRNQPNAQGSLSGTTINFYGPAYNAAKADEILSYLQSRSAMETSMQDQMVLKMQNHVADPIGRWIGGNPPTGGTIPENSSSLSESLRAVTGKPTTSHNCYGGNSSKECVEFWGDITKRNPISIKNILNKE